MTMYPLHADQISVNDFIDRAGSLPAAPVASETVMAVYQAACRLSYAGSEGGVMVPIGTDGAILEGAALPRVIVRKGYELRDVGDPDKAVPRRFEGPLKMAEVWWGLNENQQAEVTAALSMLANAGMAR